MVNSRPRWRPTQVVLGESRLRELDERLGVTFGDARLHTRRHDGDDHLVLAGREAAEAEVDDVVADEVVGHARGHGVPGFVLGVVQLGEDREGHVGAVAVHVEHGAFVLALSDELGVVRQHRALVACEEDLAVLEDPLDLGVGDDVAGLRGLGDLGVLVRDRGQVLHVAEQRRTGRVVDLGAARFFCAGFFVVFRGLDIGLVRGGCRALVAVRGGLGVRPEDDGQSDQDRTGDASTQQTAPVTSDDVHQLVSLLWMSAESLGGDAQDVLGALVVQLAVLVFDLDGDGALGLLDLGHEVTGAELNEAVAEDGAVVHAGRVDVGVPDGALGVVELRGDDHLQVAEFGAVAVVEHGVRRGVAAGALHRAVVGNRRVVAVVGIVVVDQDERAVKQPVEVRGVDYPTGHGRLVAGAVRDEIRRRIGVGAAVGVLAGATAGLRLVAGRRPDAVVVTVAPFSTGGQVALVGVVAAGGERERQSDEHGCCECARVAHGILPSDLSRCEHYKYQYW